MAVYYPRHALRIFAVLEDFAPGPTPPASVVDWVCVPARARLERNDVHTADKLTVEIDFKQFPFDPRLVRAASVSYFAACTAGGPVDTTDRANLRFVGVVDTPEAALGEDTKVTFECRDNTALLLGVRAAPAMAVSLDRALDDVLGDLLAFLPGDPDRRGVALERRPAGAAWPTVRGGGRRGARLVVEPKDTLWSLVRRVVEQSGHVAFVELDRLVVADPRDASAAARVARFAYGRNLADLRWKRNAQNLTRPVTLTCYDAQSGRTVSATWPPPARAGRRGGRRGTRSATVMRATGGATATSAAAEAEEFVVPGTYDAAALALRAEGVYRDRARTELEGSFTTYEPRVPALDRARRDAGEVDVLALATNDPVLVEIDAHARAAFDGRRDAAARAQYLRDLGYPNTVAALLATSWNHLDQLRLPFVVRKAALQIDEGGFQADVDFQNMLTPRTEGEVDAAVTQSAGGATIDFADDTLALGRRP